MIFKGSLAHEKLYELLLSTLWCNLEIRAILYQGWVRKFNDFPFNIITYKQHSTKVTTWNFLIFGFWRFQRTIVKLFKKAALEDYFLNICFEPVTLADNWEVKCNRCWWVFREGVRFLKWPENTLNLQKNSILRQI